MMTPLSEWRAQLRSACHGDSGSDHAITANRGCKTTGGWQKFHIGDEVWDQADPRHLGRLDKIVNSSRCTITWNETGWKSYVNLADLRKYDRRGRVVSQYGEPETEET